MNEIKPKDYVVANYNGKPRLIRVVNIDEETIQGVHEYKDQEEKVEVSVDSVRANLGRKPHIGKVYGANTERLIDVSELDPFHVVEWFFEPKKEEKQAIIDGVKKGIKLLQKMELEPILACCKLRVVLNPVEDPVGKTILGTYRSKSGTEDNPDIITIRYHQKTLKDAAYLIAHEAGHGVWHRLVPNSLKVKWVAAFYNQAEIEWYDSEQVSTVVKAMVKQGKVYPTGDEDTEAIAAWVMDGIYGVSGLRPRDMQLLLSNDVELAKKILGDWRQWSVPTGDWDTHVTEYANTNVDEFFCEALACRVTGKGIPDYLQPLWDQTLKVVAGRKPVVHHEED